MRQQTLDAKLMTIPSLLFALLIALGLGALYHFIRGGEALHLVAYLLMSVLGFAAGHFIGWWRGWTLFQFGPLNLGPEIVGALVFLALSDWLIHLPPRTTDS
ncbi:MAG: hypothetical protein C4583_13270 [Anaerolineaceae bacterium]|nr:MAG: hypothetical protein C4583_13270 [Anaerolineaceae bacterium]